MIIVKLTNDQNHTMTKRWRVVNICTHLGRMQRSTLCFIVILSFAGVAVVGQEEEKQETPAEIMVCQRDVTRAIKDLDAWLDRNLAKGAGSGCNRKAMDAALSKFAMKKIECDKYQREVEFNFPTTKYQAWEKMCPQPKFKQDHPPPEEESSPQDDESSPEQDDKAEEKKEEEEEKQGGEKDPRKKSVEEEDEPIDEEDDEEPVLMKDEF